jgi:hypothetical protein
MEWKNEDYINIQKPSEVHIQAGHYATADIFISDNPYHDSWDSSEHFHNQ